MAKTKDKARRKTKKQTDEAAVSPYADMADCSVNILEIEDDFEAAVDNQNAKHLDEILRVAKPIYDTSTYVLPIVDKIIDENDHQLFNVLKRRLDNFAPDYEYNRLGKWGIRHDSAEAIYRADELFDLPASLAEKSVKNDAYEALKAVLDCVVCDEVSVSNCLSHIGTDDAKRFERLRTLFECANISIFHDTNYTARYIMGQASHRSEPDLLDEALNSNIFVGVKPRKTTVKDAVARIAKNGWFDRHKKLIDQLDPNDGQRKKMNNTLFNTLVKPGGRTGSKTLSQYHDDGRLAFNFGLGRQLKVVVRNLTPDGLRYVLNNTDEELDVGARDLYDLLHAGAIPPDTLEALLDFIDYTPGTNVKKRMAMASAEAADPEALEFLLDRYGYDYSLITTPHDKSGKEQSLLHRTLISESEYEFARWIADRIDEPDDRTIESAVKLLVSDRSYHRTPKALGVLLNSGLEYNDLTDEQKSRIKNNDGALNKLKPYMSDTEFAAARI